MPNPPNSRNYRYYLSTRKFALLAGGLVVGAVLLVILGIIPQAQAIFTLWGDLQTEKKLVAQLERKANELSTVQTSVAFAQADRVSQVLPAKKPLLELLSAINLAAANTQVAVSDISLSPGDIATDAASLAANAATRTTRPARQGSSRGAAPSKKAYESMEVNMVATGTLAQINQFFIQVEKTAPASILTEISLDELLVRSGAAATTGEDQFEAEVTVTTFYYTQSVTAALEAPLPPITPVEEKVLAELDTFVFPTVQSQVQIQGGGLEDLFGSLQALPTLPQNVRDGLPVVAPAAEPTPEPVAEPAPAAI